MGCGCRIEDNLGMTIEGFLQPGFCVTTSARERQFLSETGFLPPSMRTINIHADLLT
jgi:hypothetical protein